MLEYDLYKLKMDKQKISFDEINALNKKANINNDSDFAEIVEILTKKGRPERLTRLSKDLRRKILKLKTVDILYFKGLDTGISDICDLMMNLEVSADDENNLLAGLTKLTETKFKIEDNQIEKQ